MPLSEDFNNSRLAYLQNVIKNNTNTTSLFYPRYQRAYNEAFPFTEGSIRNIQNPQNQIIQENIPSPDSGITETNLKEKINQLTRSTVATDYIFNKLDEAEAYYYDTHFDLVNKELMKKIRLPTSKEEFSRNLAMILNNDTNRNNVIGVRNYISPPIPPPPPLNAADIGAAVAAALPPPPPHLNAALATAPVAAKAPPATKGSNNLNVPPLLLAAIQQLNSAHKNTQKRAQLEKVLGDLAFRDNLTKDQLARFIKLKPRAKLTQQELDDAEQMLLDAQTRNANPNNITPPVTPKAKQQRVALLTPHRNNLVNAIKSDVQAYKTSNSVNTVPRDELDRIEEFHKQQIKDNAFQDQLQQLETLAQSQNRQVTKDEYDDLVAEHENLFKGFGVKQTRAIKHKQEFNDKYGIDKRLLKKNILALKYLKNANHVATFKPIDITDQFKSLIEKYVMKGAMIDDEEIKSLSVTEKRVLKRLYSFLKMDFKSEHNEDFQKQFEVMYGSFLAGNDSADLKKQLKEYIKVALHESLISKSEAKKMLDKLST